MNELRYLTLKEVKVCIVPYGTMNTSLKDLHQYGVELDVPAATILSTFGLRAGVRRFALPFP